MMPVQVSQHPPPQHAMNPPPSSYSLHRDSPTSDSSKSSLSLADGRQRKRLHKNPEPAAPTSLPRSNQSARDSRTLPKNRQTSFVRRDSKKTYNARTPEMPSARLTESARTVFAPPPGPPSSEIVDASLAGGLGLGLSDEQYDNNVTTFYAFGQNAEGGSRARESADGLGDPFNFDPSVNLEDVHRSIIDTEQLNQFPSPGRSPRRQVSGASMRAATIPRGASNQSSGPPPGAPTAPSSMLRRPSLSKHQPLSQQEQKQSTPRQRRQSSASTLSSTSSGPTYRTSVANIEPGNSARGLRRKVSVTANSSLNPPIPQKEYHRTGGFSKVSGDGGARVPMASRSTKSKSLQPPPRQQQNSQGVPHPVLTPEHYRASIAYPPKSPKSPASKLATPIKSNLPSSIASRRISTIPHASGLGARTVSPTDARRLKRMSTINTPPPPVLPFASEAASSKPGSPSMIPRKSVTPASSQGTTPEPNRKSYSSGLSMSSGASTSARTSIGSTLQPKLALNIGGSRLPRPPQLERDDEDIPPVPPLPKNLASPSTTDSSPLNTAKSTGSSYFSPRESSVPNTPLEAFTKPPDSAKKSPIIDYGPPDYDSSITSAKASNSNFAPRKSSLPAESLKDPPKQPENTEEGLFGMDPLDDKTETTHTFRQHWKVDKEVKPVKRETTKVDRETRRKRGMTMGGLLSGTSGGATHTLEPKASSSSLRKKDLIPLHLPPLNLLPLSTPTIARVNALAPASDSDELTPPPKLGNKTPTTPLTASKSSFFSSKRERNDSFEYHRSSSTVNHVPHAEGSPSSISLRARSSASASTGVPATAESRIGRQTASPYVAKSTPTAENEPRNAGDNKHGSRILGMPIHGPRDKSRTRKSQDSARIPVEEIRSSPSSGSSIRRKLSLSWKKSSQSKNSHAATERAEEYQPPPPKYDSMPPPRLPSAATWAGSTSTPSPSKGPQATPGTPNSTRKGSGSGVLLGLHDRTRSDSWGTQGSPKKENKTEDKPPAPPAKSSSSSLLGMSKMLGSKTSLGQLRSRNHTSSHHDPHLDPDDQAAEDEMRKLASKKKTLDQASVEMDELQRRAKPKERLSGQQVLRMGVLNLFERGEIVDHKDIFFTGLADAKKHVGDLKATSLPNFGYDDDRGDYSIVKGDHLAYRYEIVDVLGKGSFGQVVRCIDHKTGGLVAIKIIRNKKRFHQQALVEVNILQRLKEWDPQQKFSVINFTQSFYFRGHLCISTELLGMNLYEFIKSNDFRGFSLKLIRRFTKQMLSSLTLLKSHRVIHCDLKPENILLAHPARSEIKVIDFGSSCFENEKVYTYIQSRFYRSPEVILGMTYGLPIDMWSLGCILAELFTGYPIFPGENEQEQLACIMEVFGPPEKHLIEKSTRKKLFFDSHGKPRMTVSSKGRRRRPSSKTLQNALRCDDEPFLDFIARCLRWDPDKRLKPDEAMLHEFITGKKPSRSRSTVYTAYGSSTAVPANSSEKKYNTGSTSISASVSRPLPEPPGPKKPTTATTSTNSSPMKNMVMGRKNTTNGPEKTGTKRNSIGAPIGGSASSLPRVAQAQRAVSGKPAAAVISRGSHIATVTSTASGGHGTPGSVRLVRERDAGEVSSGSEGRRR